MSKGRTILRQQLGHPLFFLQVPFNKVLHDRSIQFPPLTPMNVDVAFVTLTLKRVFAFSMSPSMETVISHAYPRRDPTSQVTGAIPWKSAALHPSNINPVTFFSQTDRERKRERERGGGGIWWWWWWWWWWWLGGSGRNKSKRVRLRFRDRCS